ncbi:VOC family protein [Aquisalimonas sp.]|uniref:VOC family protein n=1 Tax=unclassified Aquisalimonas TaxID=2644645 RepID=UPI0025C64516|nr:VOC family protein [Aquisalimonas sp.]
MDQRMSVITLGVSDLARAQAFYETGVGWTLGAAEEDIRFFQLNGLILALYPREALAADAGVPAEGSGFSGVALAYNARSRDEVDRVLALAEGAGGRLVKAAQEVFWGGYSGYMADPDGHLWEVAHNPFWSLDEQGNVSLTPPASES